MAEFDQSRKVSRHRSVPTPGRSEHVKAMSNSTPERTSGPSVPHLTITAAPTEHEGADRLASLASKKGVPTLLPAAENPAGESLSGENSDVQSVALTDDPWKDGSHEERRQVQHAEDDLSYRPDPNFDDRDTFVPVRNLGSADVAALVFNKMVGTGIFTTPTLALALTQSKGICIAFWVVAGIYTGLCLLNYLQVGTWYPYNGGELIYLDRIYGPAGFLFTLFFAGTHIAFPLTAGNCIAFARFTMIAARPSYQDNSDLDSQVVKIIAIFALFAVCVILASSARFGMFLNKGLALFKLFLLIVVLGRGFATASHGAITKQASPVDREASATDLMGALILIIYSYSGWENANYVAGELREASENRTAGSLVLGAISAVVTTTILYLLVVVAYYKSSSQQDIIEYAQSFGMGSVWEINGEKFGFAHNAFGGSGRSLRVLIAVSAFGNLISVVYTSAKVKQAIARQRFLPFWKILQKDGYTPKGGLFLHFVINTIWIAALPTNTDGYSFVIGISTWGRVFIEMLVIFGLPFLLLSGMPPNLLRKKTLIWPLALVIAAFNLVIIICAAKQHKKGKIPRYWWPVVIAAVFVVTSLWWGVIQILTMQVSPSSATEVHHENVQMRRFNQSEPLVHSSRSSTVGQKIGFEVSVYERRPMKGTNWPTVMDPAMNEAELDGTNRRVTVRIGDTAVPPFVKKAWNRGMGLFLKYLC